MAIQIRSIGINRDIISASLSAGVGESPANLSITTLGNKAVQSPNIGGIPFLGKLLSYSTHKEQGKNTTTSVFIDNSIRLDQNCIVLFRRGLGGRLINVGKSVVVPEVKATYAGGSAVNFRFNYRTLYIVVERQAGHGAGGLGSEEWSSDPCSASSVTYSANSALKIIGAPTLLNGFQCAYEGSYRSVLSSIYSDAGLGYWWDWRNDTINQVNSGGISFATQTEGCGILSTDSGATREGVVSQSSWAFTKWPTWKSQEADYNVTTNSYITASASFAGNYPSDRDFLEMAEPALAQYDAIVSNNFAKLGYNIHASINFASVSDQKWKNYLWNTLQFDPEIDDVKEALYKKLGLSGPGVFYLASELKSDNSNTKKEFNTELFYAYAGEEYTYDTGNEWQYSVKSISYNPQVSQRGKNIYGSTFEDQNGIVRRGHWRSVSAHVFGDTEATDFSEAIDGCIQNVPSDIICTLVDNKYLPEGSATVEKVSPSSYGDSGADSYLSAGETLKKEIEDGKIIIFVRAPKYQISVTPTSRQINPNDLPEVYDYVDPNAIVRDDPELVEPELVDRCGSVVPNLVNGSGDVEVNNGVIGGAPIRPGLNDAVGDAFLISCNGKVKTVILPSLSSYRIVVTTEGKYKARSATGVADAINTWYQSGGISSTFGLSHSVNVSDITPDEGELSSSFTIPSAIGSRDNKPKWLKTFSADCDGFYLPIVPGLDSLTANVSSNGLRVSYSYKEIPPQVKMMRISTSIRRANSSVTLS